jgi:NAD(P)-dependent dehydrogenase (short-subunit alcohol dehydrogenase family)
MRLDFTGKIAVVTGGANGIGLATARVLTQSGALVWIFDLENERPAEVAALLGANACPVDVTEPASLKAAFPQSGPPDIVVANAGTSEEAEFTRRRGGLCGLQRQQSRPARNPPHRRQ